MKRKLLFVAALVAGALGFHANAQTDVTNTYIKNPGFESCTAYTENMAAENATDRNVDYSESGWTASAGVAWSSAAVVAYGGSGQVNGVNAPSADNAGNGGNALGISVGWGGEVTYSTEKVTLPAGYYVLLVNVNNQLSGKNQFTSKCGFVATNGTSYLSTSTFYTYNQWGYDVISFQLQESTEGYFQVGGQAVSGGSGDNAKAFFDNITLLYSDSQSFNFTSTVGTDSWQSEIGNVGGYTKDAVQKEQYNGSTVETLGEVLYQTVEGLENGTYTVELYANASYTEGRGFATDAANGDLGRAIVYAGDVEKTIPIVFQISIIENNIVRLENVVVSDGTLKMGLRKNIAGSNWHTIQIKSLVKVSSEAESDEEAQNTYWLNVAQSVMSANANVGGVEKAALSAAQSKENVQTALPTFYESRDSYNALADAIKYADESEVDATKYKDLFESENATGEEVLAASHALRLNVNTSKVANATAEEPIETNFVINGTFDIDKYTAPWICTTGAQNHGTATNQQGAFTGNFHENWDPNNYSGKIYQVIEDIPNGKYTLNICAFVDKFANNNTQYVYANDVKTYLTVGEPTAYTVEFEVTDNKVEIGFEQTEANNNWCGIDNVSLTCKAIKHAIEVVESEFGTIAVSQTEAYEGSDVTITATSTGNAKVANTIVTTASGKNVIVTDGAFTMPREAVTVSASYSVSLEVNEAGYATFSSEYPLDLSQIEGGTAYIVADEAEGEYIKLTEHTEAVPASTGLLIAGEGTVAITVATTGTAPATNYLEAGTGAGIESGYVFGWDGNDPTTAGFYVVDKTPANVPVGKAYLRKDVEGLSVGAKVLRFVFGDGTATAVETVEVAEAEADGALYNVAGQQVGKDYKGIVIKNGKKYLNK